MKLFAIDKPHDPRIAWMYTADISRGVTTVANEAVDIWIKDDGNYSLGANWTPTNSGTAANPIRFAGYKTTPGDGYLGRTNGNGPLITTNFAKFVFSSGFNLQSQAKTFTIFENIYLTGAISSAAARIGANSIVIRSAFLNTQNNASAAGLQLEGTDGRAFDVDASSTGTSAFCALALQTSSLAVHGVRLDAPNGPGISSSNGMCVVSFCTWVRCTYGFDATSAAASRSIIINPTAYAVTNSFYRLPNSVSATNLPMIINAMVTDSGRMFDSQYVGTGDLPSFIAYARTRDNSNANQGSSDWPTYGAVTTDTGSASSDYVDAGNGDLRLVATSPAIRAGIPAYASIGALQPQGGGGSLVNAGLVG